MTLPEAALIAGLIRAPSALSPWSNYDGALERSHLVLAQMREQGLITAAQEAGRAPRAAAHPAVPAAERRPRPAGRRNLLRQQFRDQFGGDHPPDWQVHTTFLPALQDAAERAVAAGLQRLGVPTRGGARRDRSARPATSSRWSAARLARSLQPRGAQPPAAGLGVQAVRVRRRARARLLAGLGASDLRRSRRRAIRNGSRATPRASRDALTLRAAALESNNAPRRSCSSESGSAVLRLAADRLARSARRPVAGARHRPGLAARSDRGLHDFPGGPWRARAV